VQPNGKRSQKKHTTRGGGLKDREEGKKCWGEKLLELGLRKNTVEEENASGSIPLGGWSV